MRKRLLGALMACGLALALLGSTTVQAQDLTTMLNLFLRDLYAGTWGATNAVTSLKFTSGSNTATLTGTGAGMVSLTGTTPTLQVGGTSASFPAIRNNGSTLEVVKADASAYAGVSASAFNLGSPGTGALISNTAPSSPTSCGSSPAVTVANGTASFVITSGTGGTATGCTLAMPTATTGWNCSITNITAAAAHRANVWTVQTASTTTSVTWEYQTVSTGAATAFTASDVFRGICFAY